MNTFWNIIMILFAVGIVLVIWMIPICLIIETWKEKKEPK